MPLPVWLSSLLGRQEASGRPRAWMNGGDPALGALLGPTATWARQQQFYQSPLEAGSHRRRMAGFNSAGQHVNSLIQSAGGTTVARARWLVRNNGYARQAVKAWSSAVVGAGIKPSSLIESPELKKQVARAFLRWTDEADSESITDFYGLQRRVSREVFLAGECFIRLRPRRPEDGLSVPLQLQMLPAEQLPIWQQSLTSTGNTIRMGVEFDAIGRRVAYHFLRLDPGDATSVVGMAGLSPDMLTRVPAEQVIHVFDPIEAGQIRGLTGYAAAIVKLFQLDIYDDAELERKKQAARFAAFLKEQPEQNLTPLPTTTSAPAPGGEGGEMMPGLAGDGVIPPDYGPGAFFALPVGTELQFSEPADVGNNFEPFQFRTLLQIAAALGVPYSDLTGDLTRASYASSRAGTLQFRGEVEAFQHSVMVFSFLRPVYRAWMAAAVLAGAIPVTAREFQAAPSDFTDFRAIPPKMPWVDPLKDRQAEALAVQNGFKSRADVVEAEGYDPEENDQRIAEDRAREQRLGLDFTPTTKLAAAPKETIDPAEQDAAAQSPGQPPQGGDQQRSAA